MRTGFIDNVNNMFGGINMKGQKLLPFFTGSRRKKKFATATLLAASVLTAGTAPAQNEDESLEEVVVMGIRENLKNAQQLKYEAETVIDSITAEDLGSFPDKSVAEALQRVSGITVNRFAATNDTAHFSAEPSGVIVRGLNLVRTEFNGRDSFSANSSRGLGWSDVSPNLMSRVDTYKNQMAVLIEGGIAGSVDMRTRLPFDQDGQMFAATIAANYGHLSEEVTPEGSILYSNRWNAGAGEIGFLANLAFSEVKTQTEGTELYRMNRFDPGVYGVTDPDITELFVPAFVNMREILYDRERTGAALAMQWQNSDESLILTAQYNRSEFTNYFEEYMLRTYLADNSHGESLFFQVDGSNVERIFPRDGTAAFEWDANGMFRSGNVWEGYSWVGAPAVQGGSDYGDNDLGVHMIEPCYAWMQGWADCTPIERRGNRIIPTARTSDSENMTQDLSFNIKWAVSDSVRAAFDVQYVDSTVENEDMEWAFYTFADVNIDLWGDLPSQDFLPGSAINYSAGQWANPNNYGNRYIMDHIEESEGDQLAVRADFEFDIGGGFIDAIKTGIRFADREQLVKWAGYNWNAVAPTWVGDKVEYFNLDRHDPANGSGSEPSFTGYPQGYYVPYTMDSEYHDINERTWYFPNTELMRDRQWMIDNMSAQALGTYANGWNHICSNENRGDKDRSAEIPGTCYTPAEVADVSEETTALYVQLDLGGGDATLFGLPYSGNLGARFVRTENFSAGGIQYPGLTADELVGTDCNIPSTIPGNLPGTMGCYLSDDDKAFMNVASPINDFSETHNHVLPSLNLKLEFTDELIGRVALSRAMSRPDIGNLRNFVGIEKSLPNLNNPADAQWITDGTGTVTGVDVIYTANAHNPGLEPVIADQLDLALEYYFADVGSLTFTAFAKRFDDYIQFNEERIDYTNNGVTRAVRVNRPINGEGAKLKGFEVAYQQFYDMLPAPWDGLGVQASYTYIDNDGIVNTGVQSTQPTGGGTETDQTRAGAPPVLVDSLESLSEDTFTFIAMYEKSLWSARLAYSWRSEYLSTAVDCCVAYPVYADDYGQIDGSFRWNFSDNLSVLLKVSNLTNEETVTKQQVTNVPDRLLLPTGNWYNDRRYTMELNLSY